MPDYDDLLALGESLRADIFSLIGAPDALASLTDLGQEAAALWQNVDQQFGALATWLTSPLLTDQGVAASDFLADAVEDTPSSEQRFAPRPQLMQSPDNRSMIRGDDHSVTREALTTSPDSPPSSSVRLVSGESRDSRRSSPQSETENPFFAAPSPSYSSRDTALPRPNAAPSGGPLSRNLPVESSESSSLPRGTNAPASVADSRHFFPQPEAENTDFAELPLSPSFRDASKQRPHAPPVERLLSRNLPVETSKSDILAHDPDAPLPSREGRNNPLPDQPNRERRSGARSRPSLAKSSDIERAETDDAPVITYKPVRKLHDLAQALGSQPYSEDQTSASVHAEANDAARVVPASMEKDRRGASSRLQTRQSGSRAAEFQPPIERESETILTQEDARETIALSSKEDASVPPEVDMDDLLEALSRSIVEDYRRFYRS